MQKVLSLLSGCALAGGIVGAAIAVAVRVIEGPDPKQPSSRATPSSWLDTLGVASRVGAGGAIFMGSVAAASVVIAGC